MVMRNYLLVLFALFTSCFLTSCMTITPEPEGTITNYPVRRSLPKSVAILPFVNSTSNPEAAENVRRMFYGTFSPLFYHDVELKMVDSNLIERGLYKKIISGAKVSRKKLGKALDVDAIVFGEVTSYGKIYALVYKDTHAGLRSKMVYCDDYKTSEPIWERNYTARNSDITVPVGPSSGPGILLDYINHKQADILDTVHYLCRKMVDTIPNPDGEFGPNIKVLVHNGFGRILKAGEQFVAILVGEPGLIGSWDLPPLVKDLPLEETKPGIYTGSYTVKPNDRLSSGRLVGYLKSKTGPKSRRDDILGPVHMGIPTSLPKVIDKDLILSADNSPYIVENGLFVKPQARLTIDAGTVIWGNGLILVKGEIVAKGTKERPIQFRNSGAKPLMKITISHSNGENIFSHCNFVFAKIGIKAIASQVAIDNCLFQNNEKSIYLIKKCNVAIEKSEVNGSLETGIYALNSDIIIRNSTITQNELGGILLDSTKATIAHNNIFNNGEWELKSKGTNVSDEHYIPYNWWGSKDVSNIRIVGPVEISPVLTKQIKISESQKDHTLNKWYRMFSP